MGEAIQNVLGIFLGSLLGIPAGLALNRAWQKRVDTEKRSQLRIALIESASKNKYLLGEIKKWISQPNATPFFNVDLTVLDATATTKYEVLNDFELCREIDSLRYELMHLARKIDVLLELEFNPTARMAVSGPGGSLYLLFRPKLQAAIDSHLDPISKALDSIQNTLSPNGDLN